jgi:tRNA U34 2-thiouridine synthase MnmA/TrmU
VEETPVGFALQLERPAFGVAPGQVVALYDGDAVVGSGVVSTAGRN